MSTVLNNPVVLTNGRPVQLGTVQLTLVHSLQFSLPAPCKDYMGFCIIQGVGSAAQTILEASLDGGQTWFSLTGSSHIVLNILGLLTGDAGAATADAFQVNGMGGATFRVGYTSRVNTPTTIWALVG